MKRGHRRVSRASEPRERSGAWGPRERACKGVRGTKSPGESLTRRPSAGRAGPATFAGLFLITLATLTYQLLLTRIFSVTMYYHFAFVAISVTMFGMAVGALVVYGRPAVFTNERLNARLAQASLGFAITIVTSFLAHLWLPFRPELSLAGVATVVVT